MVLILILQFLGSHSGPDIVAMALLLHIISSLITYRERGTYVTISLPLGSGGNYKYK